jgi:dimethylargininase
MVTPPVRSIVALVREVSPHLADCTLTHLGRVPIDAARASAQHRVYCQLLQELGARVEAILPLPAAPDAVFVEDTAIVVDEVAVICGLGVVSRVGETVTTALALRQYRRLKTLSERATLEGGDVMRVGRTLYVGRSGRTNHAGIAELQALLAPFGYQVQGVDLDGCLHLKTACTFVPPHFVLANPAWVDPRTFGSVTVIPVAEDEPFAANTLTLGGVTMVPSQWPRTAALLRARGVVTRDVDLSELAKAEGALTCSSLIVELTGASS